jgi:hypothetical protein
LRTLSGGWPVFRIDAGGGVALLVVPAYVSEQD